MKSVVIFGSRHGNTKQIAERIADVLRERGTVELFNIDEAPRDIPKADLIVIGGPTEAHSLTRPFVNYLESLPSGSLAGIPVAAFDTRLSAPRLITGSAAQGIVKRLRQASAVVLVPPESFIVSTGRSDLEAGIPHLHDGELDHATAWAKTVLDAAEASRMALVG